MRIFSDKRSVVVGVDGSPNSLAALRRAADEAEERRARLDVYRILPDDQPTPGNTMRAWFGLRSLVAAALPTARHVTTRLHIAYGDPATALINAALHAEALVIGAREHSENGSPLSGRTIPAIVAGTRCPVVICANQRSAWLQDI